MSSCRIFQAVMCKALFLSSRYPEQGLEYEQGMIRIHMKDSGMKEQSYTFKLVF